MNNRSAFGIAVTIGIFAIFSYIFKQCRRPAPQQNNSVETTIKTQLGQRQAEKIVIEHHDSIVYIWRNRWREIKVKSEPCDSMLPEVIKVTDSIIVADSVLIMAQAKVIAIDDSIIKNYQLLVKNDSISIASLRKEIKRHKRQKWLIGAAALLGLGAASAR